ncbi:hypothetical protein VTK56DRAFT_9999 [Thermocarpiscus australiensis]
MTIYVHLVRHAQGYHNLSPANHALPDPDLTPLGREQCTRLRQSFPHHDAITHLVASPLRRTLYTCLLSFEPALRRDPAARVVALPELQEVGSWPCDTGSPPEALAAEFGGGGAPVDLDLVREGWNDKTTPGSPFAPEVGKLEARARRARQWLREVGRRYEREHPGRDAHIVAVTHGGFVHFLTQDWDGMNPEMGTGWDNTEWRSYEFVGGEQGKDGEGEEEEEARLAETRASWRRRRGSAKPLTETEQMELRMAVGKGLEAEFPDAHKEGQLQ